MIAHALALSRDQNFDGQVEPMTITGFVIGLIILAVPVVIQIIVDILDVIVFFISLLLGYYIFQILK